MNNKLFFYLSILLTVIVFYSEGLARQSVITFEEIPGSSPRENLIISDQFKKTHGVTFSFENGMPAILAEVGSPLRGFAGPPNNSTHDKPAPNQNVGKYFLTTKNFGPTPPPLLITYDSPVSGVSGEILDIDSHTVKQYEAFTIQILGKNSNLLDKKEISSRDPGTGDGIATTFSFSRPEKDIYFLRIVASGNKKGFGIAFDNFSPASPAKKSSALGEHFPTKWRVNCNGYVGWLVYNVDKRTGKLEGTLLGTPVEGFLIGRRILLHRYPDGKRQTLEGWIMDKTLGAPGKPFYESKWIISGSISLTGGDPEGVYPWYGVSEN